jgi:hypothetical protein
MNSFKGHVASTWGTAQEQSPPSASYTRTEFKDVTRTEDGKSVVRTEKFETQIPVALDASRIQVNFHLDPRQKGLLWYSTYQVDFAADYSFRNDGDQPRNFCFRFRFPAQKAVYDGLSTQINGQSIPSRTNDEGGSVTAMVPPGETAVFHLAYRSQGLNNWRYRLGDGVAQAHDFNLKMQTNFQSHRFCR